ncbi:MAG: sialate O-acetylesterase, partial [Verrucomicrobiae bacterium]|nr:sialate O-acetylesterase [Verrucomicrobiae bacterium]
MDPLAPNSTGQSLTVSNSQSGIDETFEDVLVGEVWFCSGQSNTNMNLYKSYHAETEIALSGERTLRWFTVRNEPNPDRADINPEGKWVISTRETSWEFSAYAYYFAEALQDQLEIPVGVIQGSMGGTPVEAWISLDSLQSDRAGRELLSFWKDKMEGFTYAANPNADMESLLKLGFPSGYYNGRVAPAIPYGIRGAIWYQGESNRFRAQQYAKLFPLMIESWRNQWHQGDFPFYYVQLANIGEETNRDSEWPLLQFVQ